MSCNTPPTLPPLLAPNTTILPFMQHLLHAVPAYFNLNTKLIFIPTQTESRPPPSCSLISKQSKRRGGTRRNTRRREGVKKSSHSPNRPGKNTWSVRFPRPSGGRRGLGGRKKEENLNASAPSFDRPHLPGTRRRHPPAPVVTVAAPTSSSAGTFGRARPVGAAIPARRAT